MSDTQPPHVVDPLDGHPHTHSIIFLHGRDSINNEFADELFESEASEPAGQPRTLRDLFPTIRWVFPAAPTLHSARFDTDMSQWFDIWSVEEPAKEGHIQHEGLRTSAAAVLDVVRGEEARVQGGRQRIFVAGISQGFATVVAASLLAAMDGQEGFAGLVGLSSWMPLGTKDELVRVLAGDGTAVLDSMPNTPVFLGHSKDDEIVPVQNGRALRDILNAHQEVEWHEYEDGGHWVNEPQGIDDIADFLRRHM
ncbi:hypothetical protein KVR01_008158 [Diaporthe batatas]|uniref:uncharacterized protein n=1 Tax=Diaporthe batatas TaxID=748121 RepID=UPI001D03E9A5|nr:uncharacterized protein KVR01_008158 [Diaporthe batatas]KAG8162393.1 hypothetical protein KVR01_008158 [Diaporthe batatas]